MTPSAMWMFKNPQDYSGARGENMSGDIVSDCARLVGLGFAPSANLGTTAVFEPTAWMRQNMQAIQGQSDRDALYDES